MNRIVIIGSSGAGKSTFAQALGKLLQVDVIHLDRLFWQAGWKELPRSVRREIQQYYLNQRERWIMEGTYLSSSDDRLNAADTIIFLGLPRLLCLWRIIKRHITTYRQYRLDLPDGCTDKLSLRCVAKVLIFPHRGFKQFMRKINLIREREANQPQQKTIFLFHSAKDVDAFLDNLQKHRSSGLEERRHTLAHLSGSQHQHTPTTNPPFAQHLCAMLPCIQHTPVSINSR